MNIHMAKKGHKGRTKVVCKGTFISKQSLGTVKINKERYDKELIGNWY